MTPRRERLLHACGTFSLYSILATIAFSVGVFVWPSVPWFVTAAQVSFGLAIGTAFVAAGRRRDDGAPKP